MMTALCGFNRMAMNSSVRVILEDYTDYLGIVM